MATQKLALPGVCGRGPPGNTGRGNYGFVWEVVILRSITSKGLARHPSRSRPDYLNGPYFSENFAPVLGQHFVRVGLLGQIGRFAAEGGGRFARGNRVVLRTARGLEVGEVLSAAENVPGEVDGALLRRLTVEDDLLLARLEKNKGEALLRCEEALKSRGMDVVLIDVEHLFDGKSLFFYFLGDTSPELDAITAELANAYDSEVQFQKFSDALTVGCGPGCGTEAATGSGCGTSGGGCSSCGIASACGTGRSKLGHDH